MRFLVTAGNTREPIDRVRDWGNSFTGNTGLAIAQALAELGTVHLLTSNRQHIAELRGHPQITAVPFTTHAQLRDRIGATLRENAIDGVFMSAAVSDYSPAGTFEIVERTVAADGAEQWIVRSVQAGKVSSRHRRIAIVGEPTEKLVDLFRKEWDFRGLLVKFKLEVGIGHEQLIKIGQASRRASGADFLVANTLEMTNGDDAGAYLLSEQGSEWIPRAGLAVRLAAVAGEFAQLR